MLIVKKILNNNLILAEDENKKEHIVLGKGLRFINKVGMPLNQDKIEKCFVLKEEENTQNYIRLINDAPKEYGEVIQEAVHLATVWSKKELNEQLFVTLFDHLIYAIERYHKNIVLQNKMLWEIKEFYAEEYIVSIRVLDFINTRLSINLPEEEAGNIAFHLVNAEKEHPHMEHTILATKMQKDILNIIQISMRKQIDKESLHYSRMITHIQFFLQRLLQNEMLQGNDLELYHHFQHKIPRSMECAYKISEYVKQRVHKSLPMEEVIYLAAHISRVFGEN